MMRATLYAALCSLATGHDCRTGPLQCTAVLMTKHEHARSQSARGSNLCTPDGRVLHCLLDHEYHNADCAEHEAACCMDGSYPDNFIASTEMPDCEALIAQQASAEHTEHSAGSGQESTHESTHLEHMRSGALLLKISAAAEDTLFKLRSDGSRSVITSVLRELSGAESVILQSFLHFHGSGRRLATVPDFKVGFKAHGHHWKQIADTVLLTVLQRGLDKQNVELKVDSATVEWDDVEEDNLQIQVVVIAVVSAVLFAILVGGACLVKRRARSAAAQADTGVENATDKDHDNDVESASTGTGSVGDVVSVTDSESDPSTAEPKQNVQVAEI